MNLVSKVELHRRITDVLVILGLSIAVTLPIYFFGIPRGNDLPQHYQFAIAYRDAIADGDPLPGWSANRNHGFGDVGVRFYPPLSYWVLATAELVTGNWYDGSVITFIFWFFIGGLGVYLWSREWFDQNASLLGAAIYLFAPYHVNQLYNAFTYAEFAGAAILPFCFLFTHRIVLSKGTGAMLGLAVSYALLILTHLPTTVLGSLALGVYAAILLFQHRDINACLRLASAGLLGLTASAFYWLRVVLELNYVGHLKPEYISGSYDFRSNFLFSFFLTSSDAYGGRALGFADLMLVFTLPFFVPGLVLLFFGKTEKRFTNLAGVFGVLVFALLIATPISFFGWEHTKFLQLIQFPWRGLLLISISAAVLAAAGYNSIYDTFVSGKRPFGLIASGLIVISIAFTCAQIIRPAIYQQRGDFSASLSDMGEAKTCECWWPVWANAKAFEQREIIVPPDRSIVSITRSETGVLYFHLSPGPDALLRSPIFFYPHWMATVDGERVTVTPDENGAILIQVPQGGSVVALYFEEPYYVTAANILSALAWIFIITRLAVSVIRKFRSSFKLSTI